MSNRRLNGFALGLIVGVILAVFAVYVTYYATMPSISIATWRNEVKYYGPVCVVTVDRNNHPYCSNGVKYDQASVNAYEGYELWAVCKRLPDSAICATN